MMTEPLIDIIDGPLHSADYKWSSGSGAVVEFSGIVRGTEEGQLIRGIDYEAFREMALAELGRIARETIEKYELTGCVCIHRVGFVPVGEAAVYVRAEAWHRRAAFEANIEFIEKLKQTVPIWKHPIFASESLAADDPSSSG
ncbi:MAG TPA: molybdenum cofactor biosynthesis protein MoaE [Candidatus Kapabacteria bacterium]|nr:molybdenum cofactor biosynthesis protein MoaE [Candidatus Kapabacteria bacterium]